MGLTQTDCPACGKSDAMGEADLNRFDAQRFCCQSECGTFVLEGWLLERMWPGVPTEDKEAIATYLKSTKGKRDPKFMISVDDYKAYVKEGKRLKTEAVQRA